MTQQAEQQALSEIYSEIPVTQPTDLELSDMCEQFSKEQPQGEDVPNLPRGFGQ